MRWTVEQNITLARYANLGADAVAEAILAEFGIERSRESVKMQASRLGISLARVQACPMCGHVGPFEDFTQNGICRVCSTEILTQSMKDRNAKQERREHQRLLTVKEREYARVRKEASRLQKTLPKTLPRRSGPRKKENSPDQMSLF